MAPSNVAHTPLFIGFVPSLVCVRLSTTCFAASATNTQHAPFAQQPPHNNQPLVLQPHHLLPQHTQHHNTTNHPPVGHCVALPTTKSCHGLPHCCASTTHLSGHLLLSTLTTRSVSWFHNTQHNTTQHHRHVHLWVCVVHCGWSPHTFFLCWLHHTTNTVCWLINVPRTHQLHHNTHSLVWCTMPCNHTTHMVVVVVCGAVVGVLVGWHNLHLCLSCPPCGVLHLFLHTTTLSLHPHTHCAIHTTTTAPFGATLATTTSPQTMPINHTHGVWCVVLCVAHEQRQPHQHGGDWLA